MIGTRVSIAGPIPLAGRDRRVGAGPELAFHGSIKPGILNAIANVHQPSIRVGGASSLSRLPRPAAGADPVNALAEPPDGAPATTDGRALRGWIAAKAIGPACVGNRRVGANVAAALGRSVRVGTGTADLNVGVPVVLVKALRNAVVVGVCVGRAAIADPGLHLVGILGALIVVVVDPVTVVVARPSAGWRTTREVIHGEGQRQHRCRVVRHHGYVLAEERTDVLPAVGCVQLHFSVGCHDDADEGTRQFDRARSKAREA